MADDLTAIKSTVDQLQQELNRLKEKEAATSHEASCETLRELLSTMSEKLEALIQRMDNVESNLQSEKDSDPTKLQEGSSPTPEKSHYSGIKGGPPPGMTPEQVQEFKKQGLQINALQSKAKELDARLAEADAAIKRGQEKASEMETEEQEHVKELYDYFDNVNNTLSEKIANQRVEMEKMAGDTPEPINYDPFNYGDAYKGDIVDFQARKNILEIRLLLAGLNTTLNRMKDAIRVSPSIDLGYKVVRLDELLTATGFKDAVDKGAVAPGEALHVTQGESVEPPEQLFPQKEIFQEQQEEASFWTIINSQMQTLYRLETEVGELQKVSGAGESLKQAKDLEELFTTVQLLRETKVDANTVKKMMEEDLNKASARPWPSLSRPHQSQKKEGQAVSARYERMIEALQKSLHLLNKKIKAVEASCNITSHPAIGKGVTQACLTCDRTPSRPVYQEKFVALPRPEPFSPYSYPRHKDIFKQPPSLRSHLDRAYQLQVENMFVDIYQIPRPCGGAYTVPWPQTIKLVAVNKKSELPVSSDETLLQGKDGRWYKGRMYPPKAATEKTAKEKSASESTATEKTATEKSASEKSADRNPQEEKRTS